MKRGWLAILLAGAIALASAGAPVAAQSGAAEGDEAGFRGYLQLLAARARAEGVREATIASVIPGLTINPRVIANDRSQPGAGNGTGSDGFAVYRRMHVDGSRISGGRRMLAEMRPFVGTVEHRYGVPGPVVLAIWGHETNYGRYTGDFDLARSLATLAYEGRRRALFADEFVALLKMIDRGVPRSRLVGSWAGAFGNPQFLPSVYLRDAVDADGNGFADIWNSPADTIASIANYFRDAGWRAGEPWGLAVSVPAGFDRTGLSTRLISPRCPQVFARHSRWRTIREWRALGLVPLDHPWPDDTVQASFFEPDGAGHPAFLLTGNYRVILDYNCSNFYALSVGLLADAIDR